LLGSLIQPRDSASSISQEPKLASVHLQGNWLIGI
jgi:hypothetical protein